MNYKIILYLQLTYLQLTISQQTSTVIKDLASLTKPIKSTINYLKNWDSILPSFEEYIKKITDITSDFKTKPNTSKESSKAGEDKQSIHELYIGYSYKGPKDRFNYASKDCAANIMSTNPSSRNPSAILDKNKDRYLLDKCSSERYIVVELCQEIEIQTLLLANFEFFSSTFKRFDLYASATYPPQKEDWYFAGSFEALNIKNFQAFDVNVKGYMKYLKIEFKSHYGNEYYCPISEIKVFGPTMLAGFLNNPEEPETQLIKKENFEVVSMEDEGTNDNEEEIGDIREKKEEEIKVIENKSKGVKIKSETFENQQNNILQFIESPHLTTSFNNLPIIPTSSTQCCKKKLIHLFNFEPKISYAITPYDKYQLKQLFKLKYCKAILSYTDSLKLNHNMGKTKFKKESNTEEEFKTMSSLTTESKFQDILTEMSESEDNIKQPEPTDGENINNNNGNNNSKNSNNKNNNNNGPENVFRALNRRLINLESNYQLLQAYIDNQATTFNNLFMEIDQHQLTQFQLGFKELNTLIYLQFQQIKIKQEELWEKMGDQVENMNNKRKLEINILEKKFNVLKNEVGFGKRLQLAQLAVLFIVVLVLLLAKLYNSSINQLDIRNNANNNTLWWQLTPPNSATGLQFEEEVRNSNFNENELNNINNEDVNNLIQTLENQEHNNNNNNQNHNNNSENEFYLNNYPSPETSEISIDRIPTPHPKYLDLQLNSLNNSPINYTINEENEEDIDEVDYFDLNKK